MTCDDLFDLLTTDPAEREAAAESRMQAHLEGCPRCRSLAETLAPALGLLSDAAADAELHPSLARRGPAPWLAPRPVLAGQARRTAARILSRVPRPDAAVWARLAATLLLGAALGGLWVRSLSDEGSLPPGQPALAGSLGLAAACYGDSELPATPAIRARRDTDTLAAELALVQCCTQCHAADTPASERMQRATGRVARSCRVCHLD
jgi:hypothetical protein